VWASIADTLVDHKRVKHDVDLDHREGDEGPVARRRALGRGHRLLARSWKIGGGPRAGIRDDESGATIWAAIEDCTPVES
jgi:hypothetical protein